MAAETATTLPLPKTVTVPAEALFEALAHRKLYQPRSVLRFGLVFTVVFAALLLTVFWFAPHGGLPW